MTLEQLRIFVAVADRLHFTRAAEALGLTQSAVSAAVAALENRWDLPLFHRLGRRVELTAEGAAFLEEARAVLRSAGRAESLLGDLAGLQRGQLALRGSQTVATYWLPPRLTAFRRRHPGIALDLGIGNTAQVAAAVLAGEADLGIVEGEVAEAALTLRPVAEDRPLVVVGAEHGWAAGRCLDGADLARLPWVLREPGSGTRAACEALLAEYGLDPARVQVVLELPSNEAVRAAVEAGAGAAVLSPLVVETALRAGSLHAAANRLPARGFTLLTHRERHLGRAGRAFLEVLESEEPVPVTVLPEE